jgi:hypothetical protein
MQQRRMPYLTRRSMSLIATDAAAVTPERSAHEVVVKRFPLC